MDIKDLLRYLGGEIRKIEQMNYYFETVMVPRNDADKKILEKMRAHYLKLSTLSERSDKGEVITIDEIHEAVPNNFR